MDLPKPQTKSEWMLQLVLDTINVRVFWKTKDSVFLGCNSRFASDAGLPSPNDIIGKTDYDMPWKQQAELYRDDDRIVIETGIPKLNYEEPQTTPDGRTIWLRTSKIPLRDDDDRIIGVLGTYEDITDQKKMMEHLRESETFYRAMFDQSPFPLGLNRLNGVFLDANQKWEQITGVSREEIIGLTAADIGLVDRDVEKAIQDEVQRTSGELDQFEMAYRTRKGEQRYALLSTGMIGMGGETVAVSLLNDITERKQTENALKQSEEKYRELVQTANSIILRWDLSGKISFFNEYAQSFFGYTEEEIIGKNVIGTIVPETESSGRDLVALMHEILTNPESHGTNINENMRKNGERVWVAWTNKPVSTGQDEVNEILSIGLDITARKHAEDALLESEERYKSIFNSNVDAFILFEPNGCIIDTNTRAAALYGYTRNELIGLSGKDIVEPEHYEVFEKFKNTRIGEWFDKESVDIRKDGTKFDVEIHGTRLRYGGKERLLAIVFDVTERNKARETMRLFTDVVQNMQTGLYIYVLENPNDDHTLRLTATNPASSAKLGLKEDEMIGKYIDEVFPMLRNQDIPRCFADVVRTGIPFNYDDFAYYDERLALKHYSFKAFYIPDNRVGILFEDITDIVQAEDEKRQFYRKTIEAATEGKLIICDQGEIEKASDPAVFSYRITQGEDLHKIREAVAGIAKEAGMDEDRIFDLVLCTGEATTNAIKHAHEGITSVHCKDGSILVVISDKGSGIQAINLPDVALKMGYTTAISLGMGYKAMISIADQVYLSTGPEGTTVGIEMKLHNKPEPSMIITLPDTW
ncbi:MAG: PAS domain S-box protein [Armatimonadota bacterium]